MTTLLPLLLFIAPALAAEAPKPLWNHWYTMTSGKTPFGYYNERVEVRGGKIHFQNKLWKNEEGFINEEQLGTVAETATLKPLFFNFHANYRATDINIDGSVMDNVITVKMRQGDKEKPALKRTISKSAIFSQFFPVWLGRQLKDLKPGKEVSFQAILEDNVDAGFTPVTGKIKLEKPGKVQVSYQNMKSIWYVDANGSATRIEFPDQKIIVERSDEAKAKKFLTLTE